MNLNFCASGNWITMTWMLILTLEMKIHLQTLALANELWCSVDSRIHESVITYDRHISRPGITELELGPSENSYSRARKRSVIVVLEVGGFHTGCLVTKRCTAHGRRVICPARQSSGE